MHDEVKLLAFAQTMHGLNLMLHSFSFIKGGLGKHFNHKDLSRVQQGERKSSWLRCRDETMSALLGDS